MTFSLNVEQRVVKGKSLASARKGGKLPAVMYGPKDEAVSLMLDRIAFEKMFKETGESSVITLMGLATPKDVLVHDVAFDNRKGGIIHVDFYAVEAGKEITVSVPLEFVGEAPATKHGGTLTKVLHEVEVTAIPTNLPKEIVVDVSVLDDFEKQIHISDLVLPPQVTLEHEADEVVALVQPVEEEVGAEGTVSMDAIEVEKKGKVATAE